MKCPEQEDVIRPNALNINERRMLAGSVLARGLRGERQQLVARALTQHGMLQGRATLMTGDASPPASKR